MPSESRSGAALLAAARPFAREIPFWSWFHTLSTLSLLAIAITAAARAPHWALRLAASAVAGLLVVRGFILYHDHKHGALLKRSRAARLLFDAYGIFVLTPSNVWTQTHNYHHAHTAKMVGSHVGSFPTLTTAIYAKLTPREQMAYRMARHPATVLFGYLTVFLYGMCLASFYRSPRKCWDSALALVLHAVLLGCVGYFAGPDVLFFALVLPFFIAFALGGYLFYAQHNFEGMHLQGRHEWEYTRAALESSSYMELGPVMRWFTGNIGYHHVHHLNQAIPFYRLPEAMAAIPELQNPGKTSLTPREVARCFSLKLWDTEQGRMVGFPSS